MLRVLYTLILFLSLGTTTLHSAGFSVSPLEQFVRPGRPAYYIAHNKGTNPIAVEVLAEEWTIDEGGQEVRTPTDDLVIFPTQFILQPKSHRRVKVLSRDKKPTKLEKPYRVTLTELPVSFKLPDSEVNRVYMANAYRTSFYLVPSRGLGRFKYIESKYEDGKLSITLKNTGTLHDYLYYPILEIKLSNGESQEVTEVEVMKPVIGKNIHAGATRRFIIDLSSLDFDGQVTAATLKLKDEKGNDSYNFKLAL